MSIAETLRQAGVVPVAVIDDASRAEALAGALQAGGINLIEITLRTAASLDAVAALAQSGTILTGAGTVVTPTQVDDVVDAGASFLVSPGMNVAVVERARERGVPIIPGVATPSDLMTAVSLGLEIVKFFPAGVLGGPAAIKALAAPFPGLSFVPTGGIGPKNLADYFALPSVIAVGGSWMAERGLVSAGQFDEIVTRSAEAVRLAKEARA